MKPRVRMGLIVGAIGAVLNICVAAAMGICGPVVSLIGGGVAGYFAAQQEKAASKGEGAKVGAAAGAIAGALILIGQLLGGVGILAVMQFSGLRTVLGSIPTPSSGAGEQLVYYLSGMGTALCFGVVGIALAALVGAGTGYMGTPDQPVIQPPQ